MEKKELEEKIVNCEAITEKGTKCLLGRQVTFIETQSCVNYEDDEFVSLQPIKNIPLNDMLIVEVDGKKFCHSLSAIKDQIAVPTLKKLYEFESRYQPKDLNDPIFVMTPQYYVYFNEFKKFLDDNFTYITLKKVKTIPIGSNIADDEDEETTNRYGRMMSRVSDVYMPTGVLHFDNECKNYCTAHFKSWMKKLLKAKEIQLNTKYDTVIFVVDTGYAYPNEKNENSKDSNLSHYYSSFRNNLSHLIDLDKIPDYVKLDAIKYYIKHKLLESIIIDKLRTIYFFNSNYENKNDLCASEYTNKDGMTCRKVKIIDDVLDLIRHCQYNYVSGSYFIIITTFGEISLIVRPQETNTIIFETKEEEIQKKIIQIISNKFDVPYYYEKIEFPKGHFVKKQYPYRIYVNEKDIFSFLLKFVDYILKKKLLISFNITNYDNTTYVPKEEQTRKRK